MATSLLDKYRQRYRMAVDSARPSGRRMEGFDPREYAREAARGMTQEWEEETGRMYEDIRAGQARAGRVRSGPGFQDVDRWMERREEDLLNAFAGTAQRAAGQEVRAGQLENQQWRDYYSLLAGGRDYEQARANMKKKERGGLFSSIGGLAGGLAGHFLLPGLGGELGSEFGAGLGGIAGSITG